MEQHFVEPQPSLDQEKTFSENTWPKHGTKGRRNWPLGKLIVGPFSWSRWNTCFRFQMVVMSGLVCIINIDVIADVFNTRNTIEGVTHFLLEDFRGTREAKVKPLVAK